MGIVKENEILTQAKEAQGETNTRLDALPAKQKRTNELLEWLGGVIQQSGQQT